MLHQIKLRNPAILAAMAGKTDGSFAQRVAQLGAGGVTIGGFNIDKNTWMAAQKVVKTGREEFIIPPDKINEYILFQLGLIEEPCPVFVNIRITETDALSKLCQLICKNEHKTSIVLEVNVHCRQAALVKVGAGEGMLRNLALLKEVILIPQDYDIPVSVKLRASSTDLSMMIEQLHEWGTSFLHIDSYIPGCAGPDLKTLNTISNSSRIRIIANNSIWDIETAKTVLKMGCYAFSLARPVQNNPQIVGKLGSYFASKR